MVRYQINGWCGVRPRAACPGSHKEMPFSGVSGTEGPVTSRSLFNRNAHHRSLSLVLFGDPFENRTEGADFHPYTCLEPSFFSGPTNLELFMYCQIFRREELPLTGTPSRPPFLTVRAYVPPSSSLSHRLTTVCLLSFSPSKSTSPCRLQGTGSRDQSSSLTYMSIVG